VGVGVAGVAEGRVVVAAGAVEGDVLAVPVGAGAVVAGQGHRRPRRTGDLRVVPVTVGTGGALSELDGSLLAECLPTSVFDDLG
jgi:hypothetical protein